MKEYPIPISSELPVVLPIPSLPKTFNFLFEIPTTGLSTYLFVLLKFSIPKPIPIKGENSSSKK